MRILFHTTQLFWPMNSGGRIRTGKLVEYLAQRHDVRVVVHRRAAEPDSAVAGMRALGAGVRTVPWDEAPWGSARCWAQLAANTPHPLPFVVRKYHTADMVAALRSEVRSFRPHVVVCDSLQNEPNVRGLGVPTVLSSHNVEAMILERLWSRVPNPARRAYLWLEWRKLRRFEAAAVRRFASCVVVSEDDARVFTDEYGARRVAVAPNCVDAAANRPQDVPHDGTIAFVGSMDWAPNKDAVRWCVEHVLPQIHLATRLRLRVVGRDPPADLVAWATARGPVEFTGTVDDVRPWVACALATVVPLRIGGGTRLKILESLAMETPVVSTSVGAEGLGLRHDRELLLADDAETFASSVIRLANEPETRRRLGIAGRERVVRDYDWASAGSVLESACAAAASGSPRCPA
jgi:polysaccharide biosynthesis protein PslH